MEYDYEIWTDFIGIGSDHPTQMISNRQYYFNESYPIEKLAKAKAKSLYEKFGCRTLVLQRSKEGS